MSVRTCGHICGLTVTCPLIRRFYTEKRELDSADVNLSVNKGMALLGHVYG